MFADLGAGSTGGKDFAGIQESFRVEDILHLHHHIEIDFTEDQAHEFLLLDTDAMLTAKRTAGSHAHLHDVAAEIENLAHLLRAAAIKKDQGMKIAIAGVKDIRDRQAVGV